MACQTYALKSDGFHENNGNPENELPIQTATKMGAECWFSGNDRKHRHDENHEDLEYKARLLQETGLEMPEIGQQQTRGQNVSCNFGGAPKERRRHRAEKRSSKRLFWRVRFLSAPLRFSCVLRANLKGGKAETDAPKTPFWTTVSPHDAFAAPLARSETLGGGKWGETYHRWC